MRNKKQLTVFKNDGGHDIFTTLVAVQQENGGFLVVESALGEPLLGGGVNLHLLGLFSVKKVNKI